MTRLTIEVDDQLAAVVAELGRVQNRAPADIVRSAIAQYARQHAGGSVPASVKVGQPSASVSVRDGGAHSQVAIEERRRLLERTAGMLAGRGIDGLEYQRDLRAEW